MGYSMEDKEIVWLHGEVKIPPFSLKASEEVDDYLLKLQQGESLSLPHSRPMPSVGTRCHELRIRDHDNNWRIMYRIDADVILIGEVFSKKTKKTPLDVIETCKKRFARYDST